MCKWQSFSTCWLATSWAATVALVLGLGSSAIAAESSRMVTYQQEGQTYYALSLRADLPAEQEGGASIAVLFDTSASQQGVFRESALAALEELLANLGPEDRVELMAVDLEVKPLTKTFVAPGSDELSAATAELRQQVPLGSTDLHRAMSFAANRLAASGSPSGSSRRAVVYIGDGMSVANILDRATLDQTVSDLRRKQVAVSSYAVGPKTDARLLAVLANHTGGNLYLAEPPVWEDSKAGISQQRAEAENARNARIGGKMLAAWAEAPVLWPSQVQLASQMGQTYPEVMPPLRGDRDTILLGRTSDDLSKAFEVQIMAAGDGGAEFRWSISGETSQTDNAFLVEIVAQAETDGGLSLPTAGSSGLVEMARLLGVRDDRLTRMAQQAVATGDRKSALRIAQAVLRSDPGNVQAQTVQNVVEEFDFFDEAPQDVPQSVASEEIVGEGVIVEGQVIEGQVVEGVVVEGPIPPTLVPQPMVIEGEIIGGLPGEIIGEIPGEISLVQPVPSFEGEMVIEGLPTEQGLLGRHASDGVFLDEVEQERRVFAEMLSKEIRNAVIDARELMTSDPARAIQDLKLTLDSVNRAPDLSASKRVELIDRLQTILREARYQASLKDELDRQREEELASLQERKLVSNRLARRIEREKQLMDRFGSLMDEGRYVEAHEVAQIVEQIDPNGVTPRVATLWARHTRHTHLQKVARAVRHNAFFDAMYQVELSLIPFPDDPPIVYPEAAEWLSLSNRRITRYAASDLSARNKAEERIATALRETLKAPLQPVDEPLIDVLNQLADDFDIPIFIDSEALDELGTSVDTEITLDLHNVSLRSALNLMFRQPGLGELTYTIDEEVLMITTDERANASLQTKVYPVADLVLPIQILSIGGQGGGQGGGGQGGGGQGGGGQGGGGGGFGGGGGGGGGQGGGGGGFFNVEDQVDSSADAPATAANERTEKGQNAAVPTRSANQKNGVKPIEIDATVSAETFWARHFQSRQEDPAVVRETARQMMIEQQSEPLIAMIQSALLYGQAQSWMYESLGIAMELAGREKSEIERAIMSACDFSSSADEQMLIGRYLSHIDLDGRALEVYRQVVKISPMHQEAYALGLRAAQRAGNTQGIRWATLGILKQAWPREQEEIRNVALRVAKATLFELRESGEEATYQQFQSELDVVAIRDCVIKISWVGEADLDLLVEEPGGTVCSLQEPRTTGGGACLGDTYASTEAGKQGGFSESYVCSEAFPGTYRARIRKVSGKVVADKATVDITINAGTDQERHQRQRVDLVEGEDSAVVFELEQGRRSEPLEEEQLAVAVRRQQAISQAALAQQVGSLSDPSARPSRAEERDLRRRLGFGRGGAVGFQPVIVTLTQGTQMIATGVVSKDRRYVRITAGPSFTGIGNVTTFTFAGAAAPVDNAGGGGAAAAGNGGAAAP